MKGDLYEFVVFEGEQSTYDMAQVREHLATKWGVSLDTKETVKRVDLSDIWILN